MNYIVYHTYIFYHSNMGVSKNYGTPKSSIKNRVFHEKKSPSIHFGGFSHPYFWFNTHILYDPTRFFLEPSLQGLPLYLRDPIPESSLARRQGRPGLAWGESWRKVPSYHRVSTHKIPTPMFALLCFQLFCIFLETYPPKKKQITTSHGYKIAIS